MQIAYLDRDSILAYLSSTRLFPLSPFPFYYIALPLFFIAICMIFFFNKLNIIILKVLHNSSLSHFKRPKVFLKVKVASRIKLC